MANGHVDQPPCKALLVYPRFNGGSFWNYRDTCEAIGAKYPAPPLGLITVAAMLPSHWDLRLVDLNTTALSDDDLGWADLVMTGGMLTQQLDMLRLIERCRARDLPVVVGGPDATSSPHLYEAANFRVLGEAEGVIGAFIAAWSSGARSGTFAAEKFTADVTTTPAPRFDLLNRADYSQVGVQFSRGCPFTCEFCDIIELYGRKPRAKANAQMLAELQALYDTGYRGHVDFVDDNLIGNKKAVKAFLAELVAWQKARGYPFAFSTEASLNLADDAELLSLLTQSGFFAVFIGIESPDPDVLNATRKKQNTKRDIAASVHRIYGAGLFVLAGFIVGFDEESNRVSQEISDLIEDAGIPVAMVGLLYALPNTQLTRRLQSEGRLFPFHDTDQGQGGDQCVAGLNFETARPRAEILADYRAIVARIYDPRTYEARVLRAMRLLDMSGSRTVTASLPGDLKRFGRMIWHVTRRWPTHRGAFWRVVLACIRTDIRTLRPALQMMVLYLHLGPYAQFVVGQIDRQIAEIESGTWTAPVLAKAG